MKKKRVSFYIDRCFSPISIVGFEELLRLNNKRAKKKKKKDGAKRDNSRSITLLRQIDAIFILSCQRRRRRPRP